MKRNMPLMNVFLLVFSIGSLGLLVAINVVSLINKTQMKSLEEHTVEIEDEYYSDSSDDYFNQYKQNTKSEKMEELSYIDDNTLRERELRNVSKAMENPNLEKKN